MDLYVRSNSGAEVHRIGDDHHDALVIEDGNIKYLNLQNGGGTGIDFDYVFCDKNGNVLKYDSFIGNRILHQGYSTIEMEILKNVSKCYKYIARDKRNNRLFLFQDKPYKIGKIWMNNKKCCTFNCFNHLFKFVQWEDDEPTLIEDVLSGKKQEKYYEERILKVLYEKNI